LSSLKYHTYREKVILNLGVAKIMKNEWLIEPKDNLNDANTDACNNKLLDIINQIEDGRGWRFTDEQAETLAKLVDSLIEQMKAYNKDRNKNRKKHSTLFSK